MADFTAARPVEAEKSVVVHDRQARPEGPSDRQDLGHMLLLVVIGVIFSAALIALAFQARASWTEVRDWVVPLTIPAYAIGGISLAYLVSRRAWMEVSTGLTLLFFTVALTGFNLWRAALTTGPDGLRDNLSITTGVFLGLSIAALAAGMVWVEARRPTRPPVPEL
ncbi:MAG: hypothetical protein CL897_04420 [Dehalococcoidia bacterium]|nr:hypothetical protein [Dehalococcoidia bacterium]HCV00071.1 hypothetical protein [Dehalococcoidia bacterium]|tara:strand:- start:2419 stop:2916 length:498 start_codon:yes stop_codon:yes gene_type:complete